MIDTHTHINDDLYINEDDKYLEKSFLAGVKQFLVIGYDYFSSLTALNLAKKHPDVIFASLGIHPSDVKKRKENDLKKIEDLIDKKYVKAIGEIGLDYYWDKDENIQKEQKEYFIKQIDLANKYHLPIVVHTREAINETYQILKDHPCISGGIIHCYPGSKEMIKQFTDLGYLIGIGGVVTFKNGIKLKEVAREIPLDKFVLETDAPYLAPTPYRGKPNHSKYLPLIAEEIAKLKGLDKEVIIQNSDQNFIKKFLTK